LHPDSQHPTGGWPISYSELLPYYQEAEQLLQNRVVIDDNEADGVIIKYTIKKESRDRIARFRQLLAERLKDRRLVFLSRNVELNFGPCGTCVMSNDPSTWVIDRDCRAHGIANLFIGCILHAHEPRNQPIPYYRSQRAPRGWED
jgi:choline dehydrogenase-like flavoprotein